MAGFNRVTATAEVYASIWTFMHGQQAAHYTSNKDVRDATAHIHHVASDSLALAGRLCVLLAEDCAVNFRRGTRCADVCITLLRQASCRKIIVSRLRNVQAGEKLAHSGDVAFNFADSGIFQIIDTILVIEAECVLGRDARCFASTTRSSCDNNELP